MRSNSNVGDSQYKKPEIEYMRNIAFLTKEYGMSFKEIMELPYSIFLSYLKWARLFQLEQTPEGRDALYKESAIHQTEPDLVQLRGLSGYKAKTMDSR